MGASLLYNASIAFQALEVRGVSHEHSLRRSLIGKLLRNRRWLGATALGLAGWPLEIVALLLAPLTVAQPWPGERLDLAALAGRDAAGTEVPDARARAVARASCSVSPGVALAAPERIFPHAGNGPDRAATGFVAFRLRRLTCCEGGWRRWRPLP